MLHVVNVRDSWRKVIPAATHVDGTARVQSVSDNFDIYRLLEIFEQHTQVPCLINTSFNENEPIVESVLIFNCIKELKWMRL